MLVDHGNAYLLGGASQWMWEAGRLVFPAFALVLGLGLRNARDGEVLRIAGRVLVVALVAEVLAWPLVDAGVRPSALNVCVTLAGGALLVQADQMGRAWGDPESWAMVALVAVVTWFSEYGFIGAALVWAVATRRVGWSLACVGSLCVWQGSAMPFAGVLLVEAMLWLFPRETARGPRMLFGWLYAGQFLVFSVLQ